jgi:hypothetical protein
LNVDRRFRRTYIQEDSELHTRRREKLKSHREVLAAFFTVASSLTVSHAGWLQIKDEVLSEKFG